MNDPRFDAVEAAMRRYVDGALLPGVSWAILSGRDVIDERCVGLADREAGVALRSDHLFRIFSNTKLATSCAILLLVEDGRIGLDDPVARHEPRLAELKVLRPGATRLDDTEPARRPITVRHLLTHTSGLSYGLLDPGSLLYGAYTEGKALSAMRTLSEMVDTLATLPLAFHPGEGWEYSIATDVLGHLVEVITGRSFGEFLRTRIFEPLGMVDTGFAVPDGQAHRLAAHYVGADLLDPMKPGLNRADAIPYPGAYLKPVPRESGGGGLVSTLADMTALVRALVPGGPTLLNPGSLAALSTQQLPDGTWIRFPVLGAIVGKGYGLGGAVTVTPGPFDPPGSEGELQWGGLGGTHWWISPRRGLAAVLMTQRHMGFWHPFSFEFKRLVCAAA